MHMDLQSITVIKFHYLQEHLNVQSSKCSLYGAYEQNAGRMDIYLCSNDSSTTCSEKKGWDWNRPEQSPQNLMIIILNCWHDLVALSDQWFSKHF